MNAHVLWTPPIAEPVTLAEFKAYAKIEESADDAVCTALLLAARQWCEHYTRCAFIAQTWMLTYTQPPESSRVSLPRAPLIAVTNVTVFDLQDNPVIWGSSNYRVDTGVDPAALSLRDTATWPALGDSAAYMTIEYVAGFGANAAAVPDVIKLAIKQLALHWYEYRGEAQEDEARQAPLTIEALLQPYRRLRVGGGS